MIDSQLQCLQVSSGIKCPRIKKLLCAQVAAEHGHVGCVTLMLRSGPPQHDLNKALLAAAGNGHEHAMLVLLDAGRLPLTFPEL